MTKEFVTVERKNKGDIKLEVGYTDDVAKTEMRCYVDKNGYINLFPYYAEIAVTDIKDTLNAIKAVNNMQMRQAGISGFSPILFGLDTEILYIRPINRDVKILFELSDKVYPSRYIYGINDDSSITATFGIELTVMPYHLEYLKEYFKNNTRLGKLIFIREE